MSNSLQLACITDVAVPAQAQSQQTLAVHLGEDSDVGDACQLQARAQSEQLQLLCMLTQHAMPGTWHGAPLGLRNILTQHHTPYAAAPAINMRSSHVIRTRTECG
jgi:hypothetical protein